VNDTSTSPLEAVADALRANAQRQAAALLAAADAEAQDIVAKGQGAADALLAQARSDGKDAADREARIALASARRDARGMILAAQRRAYEAVRGSMLDILLKRHATTEAAAPVRADLLVDRELAHDGAQIEALWA